MTPLSDRQRARFYKYKNKIRLQNVYIYVQNQPLCKMQDNLQYVLFKKTWALYVMQIS